MIMTDLSIISRYSRTFFERRLSELELGFPEQMIMMYLNKCDSINQDTIAKHFMLDKGAVAKALSKLEAKEFIERSDNPNNKREKLITITASGKGMIGHLNEELQQWHNILFQGLSKEEIEQVAQAISIIAANAAQVINNKDNLPKQEGKHNDAESEK